MIKFTIFNRKTKEIAGEKEFKHYIEAEKFVKENYGEEWEYSSTAFHFDEDFYAMLKSGESDRIKNNRFGDAVAIFNEDRTVAYHTGKISFETIEEIRRTGVKTEWISNIDWINMHNKIVA